MKRAAHVLRDPLGPVDLGHPLGHLPVHAPVVHLLEGLAIQHPAAHLADDEHQGSGILERDVDSGRGVGRARPAGDHAHPGPAGQLAVRFGHHRGAALLAADHRLDARKVVEPVDRGEKALPRHEEDPVAPLDRELVGEDPAAVAKVTHRRAPSLPAVKS